MIIPHRCLRPAQSTASLTETLLSDSFSPAALHLPPLPLYRVIGFRFFSMRSWSMMFYLTSSLLASSLPLAVLVSSESVAASPKKDFACHKMA
jgi:hypothetical protein